MSDVLGTTPAFLEVVPTEVIKHPSWKRPLFHRWRKVVVLKLDWPQGHTVRQDQIPQCLAATVTCPFYGSRVFFQEGDVCFPFGPLHLIDPASITIIFATWQPHLIKHKQVEQHLEYPYL